MLRTLPGPALALLMGAVAAQAGTFEMQNVSAVTTTSTYGYIGVEVRGSARYTGALDGNDVHYQINTLLNHNRDGGSLSNWSAPDAEGASLTGHGIVEGMIITCTGSCAAYANLYRENCPTTYNYVGRGAVAIYHQFSPEIDTMDTAVYLVSCYTPPDGGGGGGGGGSDPCGPGTATVTTASSIETGALLNRGPGAYPLDRRDTQGRTRYLLEEWAVLSVAPGVGNAPTVGVLNASSQRFAGRAAANLRRAAAQNEHGTLLVVEGVDHPRNERYIPPPDVIFHGAANPESRGQDLVVRADFARTGELLDLQVLYADREVSEDLLAVLWEGLEISYADSRRHRAIAFGTFDLGERVTVRSSQTILPLCCCYTDETGIWCE